MEQNSKPVIRQRSMAMQVSSRPVRATKEFLILRRTTAAASPCKNSARHDSSALWRAIAGARYFSRRTNEVTVVSWAW
ncbi:unnamed protein product [Heligmosomoides polygyrus]|uniref:Uncharacterized protein n=1 Tax=Heligmosomoides polygyrus TaxID=6339 RepID=A0A183FGI2_HELPZ|nr:unnamed protein product [Heligmosomoides polygyrus]